MKKIFLLTLKILLIFKTHTSDTLQIFCSRSSTVPVTLALQNGKRDIEASKLVTVAPRHYIDLKFKKKYKDLHLLGLNWLLHLELDTIQPNEHLHITSNKDQIIIQVRTGTPSNPTVKKRYTLDLPKPSIQFAII